MKAKIYNILEKEGSKANRVFEVFIVTLIILNVISIGIETIRQLSPGMVMALRIFEAFSITMFSVEYVMRLYVADLTHPASTRFRSVLRFMFSFFGLIDLAAILPFYVPFIIHADMRFLRILRLIRFFRIFKLSRYNFTLQLIWDVIKEKKSEFIMTFFISFLLLLVSAFVMYYVEGPYQPDKFSNIFAALWWAVGTLTPLGYGGFEPISNAGKVISAIVAIIGIGLIALPTGILSAGFTEKLSGLDRKKGREAAVNGNFCPHCGKPLIISEDKADSREQS
ncbi:MAG TPA: ion transporter [Bacteroidales bacterium]|nr:ion transporter [Bacteroidales bacterium]